ncbi:MAG: cytochrome c [Roseibacillus sp.]|nr:cytochrome c [Roseibacillus sp.]
MAKSQDTHKTYQPDLEDSTKVVEDHDKLLEISASQARENQISETGMEPVSLWVFLASAVVLLIGGGVLGAGGKLFSYSPHPEGYTRPEYASDTDTGPTIGPIIEALSKRGKNIYAKCSGCHGSTGGGDGNQFPPLAGSDWVTGTTDRLAQIILNGLSGPIDVAGKTYNGNMPAQAPLTAAELAAVMTYIRNEFNDVGDVVSLEQAANALKTYESRPQGAITVKELTANHDRMLEGEAVDPSTSVNFETLQPAAVEKKYPQPEGR